jgi:hypothetical protein
MYPWLLKVNIPLVAHVRRSQGSHTGVMLHDAAVPSSAGPRIASDPPSWPSATGNFPGSLRKRRRRAQNGRSVASQRGKLQSVVGEIAVGNLWCFPFSSEGKARGCARTLIEQGMGDIGLSQRAGVWHVTAPADSERLREATFFLTGKGLTGSPIKLPSD